MPHHPTAPPPRAALAVPTRWPVPPLIQASVGLHVAAAGAAWLVPGAWPWAAGAVVANHLVLTAAGLWPRSRLLGPNITRLPDAAAARGEIAITIDDGPDPQVTPATLDLLAGNGVRATFFCIAERARAHPALLRRIVDAGHGVGNHSRFHRHHFSLLGPRGFEREIGGAQDLLADACGVRPTVLSRPGRLAQPAAGPGAAPAGPAPGELDAAWLRHPPAPTPAGCWPACSAAWPAATSCCCTTVMHAAPRSINPCCCRAAAAAAALPRTGPAPGQPGRRPAPTRNMKSEHLPGAPADTQQAWQALHTAACQPYRQAGRWAWHWARGKLGRDPVFRGMLERGDLLPKARVCRHRLRPGPDGQPAAGLCGDAGRVAGPPAGRARLRPAPYTGIELMPKDVARAQAGAGQPAAAAAVCLHGHVPGFRAALRRGGHPRRAALRGPRGAAGRAAQGAPGARAAGSPAAACGRRRQPARFCRQPVGGPRGDSGTRPPCATHLGPHAAGLDHACCKVWASSCAASRKARARPLPTCCWWPTCKAQVRHEAAGHHRLHRRPVPWAWAGGHAGRACRPAAAAWPRDFETAPSAPGWVWRRGGRRDAGTRTGRPRLPQQPPGRTGAACRRLR
jgi:peptidoglycan/xylan/chitin deacetylase (PgdA/CDA1 family)